jgi:hypothetical protein
VKKSSVDRAQIIAKYPDEIVVDRFSSHFELDYGFHGSPTRKSE